MTWGFIGGAAVTTIGTSLLGGGGGSSSSGQTAAAAADPFASQRGQYQTMLQNLMTDPGSYTQSPQSQGAVSRGIAALNADAATKGLSVSGSQQQALTNYATQSASSDYYNQLNLLSTLSGATAGNTGAASSALTSANQSNTAALGTLGSVLGQNAGDIFSGISGLFGQNSIW